MTAVTYLWTPSAPASLPVKGHTDRLPVERLFFVGRNYQAHAAEMGLSVDKSVDRPFYFTKSPQSLTPSGSTAPYPPQTANHHHEVELVVVLGRGGFEVKAEHAHELIWGYACGLDMTRRDLQQAARQHGKPWDLGKDVEGGAVVSEVVPMPGVVLEQGAISLTLNGEVRQQADLNQVIWGVRELIADLSLFYHLRAGDLIFTGTPEGVGPVKPGDQLRGHVEGVGMVALDIGPAA